MFAVSRFFHLQTFIFSLAIGLFLVYIQTPEFNTIYVYPNPDNEDKILYKDKTNTCYKMKSQEVKCPIDATKIREYPVQ
tara:strand:+ start:2754 stop:2990 length:237 start_codon:yes stop_codon:yes gene_type:complete